MAEASPLADLDRVLAVTEIIVAGLRPDRWSAPTPCTDLDVWAVLNHPVSGNLLFAAIVGETPPPKRGADHLGADPLAAYQRAAGELRAALAAPGVLESVYTAPFGTGPGAALVAVRITENLVHGWDLARATGQPADFPDDVTERALAAAKRQLSSRPAGPDAPFAAEVPVADDASPVDRLAGFFGRAV